MPFQWIILDAQWRKIERFTFKKLSPHSERRSISLLLPDTNAGRSCPKAGRAGGRPGAPPVLRARRETSPKHHRRTRLTASPPAPPPEGTAGEGSRFRGASRGAEGSRTPRLGHGSPVLARSPDRLRAWGKSLGAGLRQRVCRGCAVAVPQPASRATLSPEQWEPLQVISSHSSCLIPSGFRLPRRFLAISKELSHTSEQKGHLREPSLVCNAISPFLTTNWDSLCHLQSRCWKGDGKHPSLSPPQVTRSGNKRGTRKKQKHNLENSCISPVPSA